MPEVATAAHCQHPPHYAAYDGRANVRLRRASGDVARVVKLDSFKQGSTVFSFLCTDQNRTMKEQAATRRLKILHTMTWLAPGGGADKNVWYSIDGLMDEHELHLSSGCEIFRNEFADIDGLPIHICPHLYRSIRPIKDLQALFWYYRLIRRHQYDVVHTHEGKSSLVVRVAAWLARTPHVIFGLHGVFYRNPESKLKQKLLAFLEKATIWMNDSVVSVSETCMGVYHDDGLGRKLPTRWCTLAWTPRSSSLAAA